MNPNDRLYCDLPDDPEFSKQTRIELLILFVIAFLLAGLLVVGSCYGFYDWMDKTDPIINHIEKL